jgi:hypothetical protein
MTLRPMGFSSVVPIALLIFGWQSAAQNPGGPQAPGTTPGPGPYKAVMEMDAGLPDHTIYRPDNLSELNGVSAGNSFSNFLTDISSYGYLVIALGPRALTSEPPRGLPPAATSGGEFK